MNNEEKESLYTDFNLAFKEVRDSVLEQFVDTHSDDENYLLSLAPVLPISKQKKLLGTIFEKSKWFGNTVKTDFDKIWTVEEIKEVLSFTDIYCVHGFWKTSENNQSCILKHHNCNYEPNLFKCRYWYNAVNGLIVGLSDKVVFVRYESLGNEDLECTNIIFNSENEDTFWKSIPENMKSSFDSLRKRFNRFGIKIEFCGYADGTVFYDLQENISNNQIKNTKKILTATILKLFSLHESSLKFVNVSERKKYSRSPNTNL